MIVEIRRMRGRVTGLLKCSLCYGRLYVTSEAHVLQASWRYRGDDFTAVGPEKFELLIARVGQA